MNMKTVVSQFSWPYKVEQLLEDISAPFVKVRSVSSKDIQHHESNRIRKFVITDCGCTLVVKCHDKRSCIQGSVVFASY
ncbi:unnamed protein product [Porites lobata]|uniref:Uncharacterized protein n=1 Tax=Porites lobata TaxID=104759 RepID=A0ABN8MYD3_9CNID|nr:unnamed protein product [Porites lobata]